MSIKKILLLSTMALALGALIAPAYASAVGWLHEGKPVKEGSDETIELTGTLTWVIAGAHVECKAHPTLTVTGPNEAEFTKIGITTSTCKGTGFMAGCSMALDKPTNFPWAAHPISTTEFAITDFTPDGLWKCKLKESELNFDFPEVIATPDVPAAMNSVSLAGEGTAIYEGSTELEAQMSGELAVTGGAAGKYGIG